VFIDSRIGRVGASTWPAGNGDSLPDATVLRTSPASSVRRRERIVAATVEVVAERGYAGASVGLVIARAKVSRHSFYSHFSGLDGCVSASLDLALERSTAIVVRVMARKGSWVERMRATLAAMLMFFDSEPQLARICLVHTLGGSDAVRSHRERLVAAFRAQVIAAIGAEVQVSPLLAENVLASIMGVVYTRLVTREQRLIDLLGPLMETAVRLFAMSEHEAYEERLKSDELARAIRAGEADWILMSEVHVEGDSAAGKELPAGLANPNARRARECLRYLAEHPGSSNREVACGIGVAHSSQISKLLSELAAEGLASRRSLGVGRRNAWQLTKKGRQADRALSRQGLATERLAGDMRESVVAEVQ